MWQFRCQLNQGRADVLVTCFSLFSCSALVINDLVAQPIKRLSSEFRPVDFDFFAGPGHSHVASRVVVASSFFDVAAVQFVY